MLYMVTGGNGSGKSEYAEKLAVSNHRKEQGSLYYIATMIPYDKECRERIRRHRVMRKDKGFQTLECFCHLEKIHVEKNDVVLLECMSNLLANEMYQENGSIRKRGKEADKQLKSSILEPILQLKQQAGCFIVVTNEVFSDGVLYEEETKEYIRLLGKTNIFLANHAEFVTEVVCSIPVYLKGSN